MLGCFHSLLEVSRFCLAQEQDNMHSWALVAKRASLIRSVAGWSPTPLARTPAKFGFVFKIAA